MPAGRASPVSVLPMPVHQVVVDVMLKPEILDPQGQAVGNAIPTLGSPAAVSVRVGKHIELALEAVDEAAALRQAAHLAQVLLSNPVIEDFEVHPAAPAAPSASGAAPTGASPARR